MAQIEVPAATDLKDGQKKVITVRQTKILFLRHEGNLVAVEPTCPHAGGPLEKGAICNGRLVCPWHMGTFALPSGALVEPPAMEGLKTYSVREDNHSCFIDLESRADASSPKAKIKGRDRRNFVVVGAGAAGSMAVTTLVKEGFKGRILVIDPVADEPIDRTQLSKQALSGKAPLTSTQLGALDKIKSKRISASVVSISSKRKEILLSDGQRVQFDAALIATGGSPDRLDIFGNDMSYTLRHAEDVRHIRAKAKSGSEAVIIGTNFIGLEAASALTQRGVKITIVGRETLPFEKQFGTRVGKAILALHKRKGVKFHLGVTIVAVSTREVTIEEKDRYRTIPSDFVLMGVGVSPALKFDHDLPVAEDGGIETDESLLAKGQVWVAGDIANVKGTRIEHWRVAQQHGMAAARQMLGSKAGFKGVPFFWTFHFGKRLDYLGHTDDWDRIVFDGDVNKLDFLAFYVKAGRVAAVLSCGRESETAMLAEMMRENRTLREIRSELQKKPSS